MEANKILIDLCKPSSGSSGGSTDYSDLSNKPKINSVTLSGNKTSAQLGLVGDVQVNGTSVTADGVANIPIASSNNSGVIQARTTYGFNTNAQGALYVSNATESVFYRDDIPATFAISKGTMLNIQNTYVRSVSPACTTLSGTTATITANTTYANTVDSSGCVYTISTPTDLTAYNGFILMLDTTNSASIAFQTDSTPAVSIQISGNPTIETGKKYTVTGQFSPLSNAWELFIISYEV